MLTFVSLWCHQLQVYNLHLQGNYDSADWLLNYCQPCHLGELRTGISFYLFFVFSGVGVRKSNLGLLLQNQKKCKDYCLVGCMGWTWLRVWACHGRVVQWSSTRAAFQSWSWYKPITFIQFGRVYRVVAGMYILFPNMWWPQSSRICASLENPSCTQDSNLFEICFSPMSFGLVDGQNVFCLIVTICTVEISRAWCEHQKGLANVIAVHAQERAQCQRGKIVSRAVALTIAYIYIYILFCFASPRNACKQCLWMQWNWKMLHVLSLFFFPNVIWADVLPECFVLDGYVLLISNSMWFFGYACHEMHQITSKGSVI